ncbi:LysR family transcriptional regulator [Sphingobium sp. CAP-1]|uniref:LysR family transcriptional regulator n=1 Tax=Sphingobium sp. CAP-1 TaxID=2676077 RepID=UPI0012BB281B|nr:LysR family transcriptional regulator [Sphingobium sp. CAP-1]QGP81156.1 LysR family transcriptional regulator [Sphingobium sp. CAP-1]
MDTGLSRSHFDVHGEAPCRPSSQRDRTSYQRGAACFQSGRIWRFSPIRLSIAIKVMLASVTEKGEKGLKMVPQGQLEAISFRQLRLFESVGRLESVRRASEDCNLSQPAVTQSLSKLEQLVGAQLVERRASGSYLNASGQLFYRRVARFIGQFEQALAQFGVEGGMAGAKLVSARLLRSQVRVLIAIVEHGSFALAAQSLDLSPATLQRAARDLESNLRKPLFYRGAAGTMLLPDGAELGRRLKLSLQEVDLAAQELAVLQGGATTPIVVGAMPLGGSVLLASMLDDFIAAAPQAQVVVRSESAVEMLKTLRAGDVDFVVGLLPRESAEDLEAIALAHTPYSIVAREGHPLLRQEKVTRDDLGRFDWLVGAVGSSRRDCFDHLFAGHPEVRAPIATSALAMIRPLMIGSDRLTLMTSYELQHEGQGLAAIPFGPIAPVPVIGVTSRANWLPTRLHADFLQMLRDHVDMVMDSPLKPPLAQGAFA